MVKLYILILVGTLAIQACTKKETATIQTSKTFAEKHRPQIHFSPPSNWMNDPNGLVYVNGKYHLFYQHYPKDIVWGPMHWGHATSSDLVHWKHLPIALYPDSLGMIFSGSAVLDKYNTSGFGTASKPALVAMYTYHNSDREKAGHNDYQTQGIAYSVDEGKTWEKYNKNPVINNPGDVRDFRDPKVFWHDASKQWIVTLVAADHAEFYGSKDLKQWRKLSEFGKAWGAHGGVWECPDLFPLTVAGEPTQKWILIVNINPGGPNGGSATQYFIGDFDGKTFTCDGPKNKISWIDYGPDNYAGITWSNAPDDRKIFIGWMSNWDYAQTVPTSTWRSAATIPRELKLVRIGNDLHVVSLPVPELSVAAGDKKSFELTTVGDSVDLSKGTTISPSMSIWSGSVEAKDWKFSLSNAKGQKVEVGYDKRQNRFFIDRHRSGDIAFAKSFGDVSYGPRFANNDMIRFSMVIDVASVEVFFDEGATVMTSIFFPDTTFNQMIFKAGPEAVKVDSLNAQALTSIWQ